MTAAPAHMNPAAAVIERHGGVARVAEDLGIPIFQVYRWRRAADRGGRDGMVPSRYQLPLLEASKRRGTGLTAAMIIGVE